MSQKVKKLVFSCLRVAVAVYLVILAAFFVFQKRLIFKPVPLSDSAVIKPPISGSLELSLEKADGGRLSAIFVPAPELAGQPRRVILHCHGNAGNLLDRQQLLADYHQQACAALAPDWCGYGKTSGSPDEAGIYAEAEMAFSWLLQQGWKEEEIVIHGTSLGGGPACWLAERHPGCAGLILCCTFTRIPDMARHRYPFLPPQLCTTRFDNLKRIAGIKMPLLVIHGTEDQIVPSNHSERLYAAAASPVKRLVLVPKIGHNDLEQASEFWGAFGKFVRSP
ncbi:MAG: hypothetical protein RL095_45 [Verrucomicrobiota bacterium]|jgi:fermentation-respiration switch protein FrsA (DUF1100 family)